MEVTDETLTELVRLTRDNNRMLRSMRRRAFWGGIVKFLIYAGLFIALPLWLYATYLAPMMDQVLDTYQQIQGTGAKAQAQFSDFQNFLKEFQNQFSSQ